MALSIFLRDSIERRVSTSLVNGNERSWFRHYQKKAGWWNNKLELRGRGGKRSGSKPNNANFISSVYNFASKRGSRLGCFDAHHAVTNYRVSQLERNYSLANGTILFLLFFFFTSIFNEIGRALATMLFFPSPPLCGIAIGRNVVSFLRENDKF